MEDVNKEKINICHICSYYGNMLFDHLVLSQLEFTNPRVFFFKTNKSEIQYKKNYIDEVKCYSNIERIFYFIKSEKAYRRYLNIYSNKDRAKGNCFGEFDLNFAHSLFANGYIAYRDKVERGTPYVVAVQNTDLNEFYRFKPYLKRFALKMLLNAERVIFASSKYKEALINRYVPENKRKEIEHKAVVIPYGIEEEFYVSAGKAHAIVDSIEVLSVGQIRKNKNHIRLAKAIKMLRKDGYDVRLTVVGEYFNNLIVRKLKKYDFVRIMPHIDKRRLREIYKASDIFALTSITETFGLVYAEALSQGLPIVYSKGQGFDGQFPEGYVGYHVNVKDIDDIKRGIEKVIDKYCEMVANVNFAAQKFRWKVVAEQYRELYRSIFFEFEKSNDDGQADNFLQ